MTTTSSGRSLRLDGKPIRRLHEDNLPTVTTFLKHTSETRAAWSQTALGNRSTNLGSDLDSRNESTLLQDEIDKGKLGEIHIAVLRIVGDESAGGGLEAFDGNKSEPAHGGHVAV